MTPPKTIAHRSYWVLNEQLQFGPSISSDPKDHATLVAVFRIPIKSNAVHLVEYSALLEERAKSARLLEVIKQVKVHLRAPVHFDALVQMSQICGDAIEEYKQSEGGYK